MVELTIGKNKLSLCITDTRESKVLIDVSGFLSFGEQGIALLKALVTYIGRCRYSTLVNYARGVKDLSDCFAGLCRRYPETESQWQDLVLHIYRFTLTRTDSRKKLETRSKAWNRTLAHMLEFLRDHSGLVPIGIEIPRNPTDLQKIDISNYRNCLIGQTPPHKITSISKLLVSVSLAHTDAIYLEGVRDELLFRRRVLEECLISWWKQLKAHHEYGKRLIARVDWPALKKRLDAGDCRYGRGKGGGRGTFHIANGSTDESLGYLLAILRNERRSYYSRKEASKSGRTPVAECIKIPSSAPDAPSSQLKKFHRLNWMLGNLFPMDIAVCMALLTMRNPQFTTFSLLRAKIFDKKGRPYLELDGLDTRFRIEKARARSMKESNLDDLSIEIIRTVLEMTERHRRKLKKQKSPLANLLFFNIVMVNDVGYALPQPGNIGKLLSHRLGQGSIPFLDYFPKLQASGFAYKSINFSKIRATEGVLEWFRSGSITAMSKKLGNTKRVILTHYLPKPLLAAWNTRLIRRFQNLWIIAAAAKEDFLLEVTDFHSLQDLNAFLFDILTQHAATSSPLAAVLHEQFGKLLSDNAAQRGSQSSLAISISEQALAALYLYQDASIKAGLPPGALDKRDVVTNLCPRQFVQLAELLRHQLPTTRDPIHRKAHDAALKIVDRLHRQVSWVNLFATLRETQDAIR